MQYLCIQQLCMEYIPFSKIIQYHRMVKRNFLWEHNDSWVYIAGASFTNMAEL